MAKAKRYELDDSKMAETVLRGQAALVATSLLNRHPQTVEEVANDIKDRLVTRQDPIRVVSFYISTWKKTGLIVVAADEAPVTTERPSEVPVPPDYAGDEDEGRDVADLEDDADAEEATSDEFDYVNSPLTDAVAAMASKFDDPVTPKMLAEELQVAGRTVTAEQVRKAAGRLVDKRILTRVGEGRYATA